MIAFLVLLIADIIIAVLYAKEGHPEVTIKAFWLKMLASGIFLINGVTSYFLSNKNAYQTLIVIALALGMLGDALLSFEPFFKKGKNRKRNIAIAFVIGAGFFFAGHMVYIAAFYKELKAKNAFKLVPFIILLLSIVLLAIIIKTALRVRLGRLALPMLVYALALSSMGAFSIMLSVKGFSENPMLQVLLITAPLLFITSDSSLALKFADRERFGTLKVRMLTLLTYYTAQMLFGLSVKLI